MILADINAVGFVVAGWGITIGALVTFAVSTIRKERQLAATVPEEERTWS